MNNMDIVTDLDEGGSYWKRLHVQIKERHGVHNQAEEGDAELCQLCAITILTDALKRVKKGERTTAGAGHADQQGWNK